MRRIALILVSLLLSAGIMADSQHTTSGNRGRNPHRTEQHGDRHKRPDRPGKPSRPGHPHQPAHRPGATHRPPSHRPNTPALRPPHPPHMRPPQPQRPHRPLYGFHRPPRPAHWYPRPGSPSLGQIIGITLGSAFSNAINHLVSQGISYTNYGNNTVYVNNVSQYGYMWPDGTLYYSNGYLAGGEFHYYTGYPDTQRYYDMSRRFTNQWGNPCNVTTGATMSATWFTPDNGYITLRYDYLSPNYVTTLTVGQ